MHAVGNHEIELDSFDNKFASYSARYPNAGTTGTGNSTLSYYSVEASSVHTFFLNAYIDHSVGSPQYNW